MCGVNVWTFILPETGERPAARVYRRPGGFACSTRRFRVNCGRPSGVRRPWRRYDAVRRTNTTGCTTTAYTLVFEAICRQALTRRTLERHTRTYAIRTTDGVAGKHHTGRPTAVFGHYDCRRSFGFRPGEHQTRGIPFAGELFGTFAV